MARSILSRRLALLLALVGGSAAACVETGPEVCANGFVCPFGDRCVDIGRDVPLCVLGEDTMCVFSVTGGRELRIPCKAGSVCDSTFVGCVSVAQYEPCTGKVDLTPCQEAGRHNQFCRDDVCTGLSCGDGYPNPSADEVCDPADPAPDPDLEVSCNVFCQAPTPVLLDLLLVIDGTPLREAQDTLAPALEVFMDEIVGASDLNVDVHLGVTTTDATSLCGGTLCAQTPRTEIPSAGYYLDAPPIYCGATLGRDGRCLSDECTSETENCGTPDENLTREDPTGCPRCRNLVKQLYRADDLYSPAALDLKGQYHGPLRTLVEALANTGSSAGFRREGALLAIVVLTNRDDCSAHSATFYDPSDLHPSYRCFREGTVCDLETAGPDGGTTYSGCQARVDGLLVDPTLLAGELDAALRADATPQELYLQVLAGVPSDDATVFVSASHELGFACDLEMQAEPGIRLLRFVEELRGLRELGPEQVRLDSFCGSSAGSQYVDYQAALDRIMDRVRALSHP